MKTITLTNGDICIVSDEDYKWARHIRWAISGYGYARESSQPYRMMHRMILGLEQGDKRQGDHKNGDKLDNRRSNLRIVTYAQNRQNEKARKTYGGKPPSSKHRGVFYRSEAYRRRCPTGKHWYVKHRFEGKEYLGGSFFTEEEADVAAQEWRKKNMPFSTH